MNSEKQDGRKKTPHKKANDLPNDLNASNKKRKRSDDGKVYNFFFI